MDARTQDAVRTLAHRPAVEVHPDDTLRQVAVVLAEESIGAVVVRGTHSAEPRGTRARGLVSERDIVRALAEGADPDDTLAEQVMTTDMASARPDERIVDVTARLLDNEIRHLPIVDAGVVVGMLSARDVLTVWAQEGAPGGG